MTPPLRAVTWTPCWRIIPSRVPPIQLFERVADPADLPAVIAVESLTNDRIRDEVGKLELVSEADRISGPGSSVIMAAFCHPNPDGSRFSDGSYGVFYAGKALETSIAETRHHREAFMRATAQAAMELPMRVYAVDLQARKAPEDRRLHDLRGRQKTMAAVYDPDDYTAGQGLGGKLHTTGSWGLVYDSVRHPGGECVGVFRPPVLSRARQERHLLYRWDGTRIVEIR